MAQGQACHHGITQGQACCVRVVADEARAPYASGAALHVLEVTLAAAPSAALSDLPAQPGARPASSECVGLTPDVAAT